MVCALHTHTHHTVLPNIWVVWHNNIKTRQSVYYVLSVDGPNIILYFYIIYQIFKKTLWLISLLGSQKEAFCHCVFSQSTDTKRTTIMWEHAWYLKGLVLILKSVGSRGRVPAAKCREGLTQWHTGAPDSADPCIWRNLLQLIFNGIISEHVLICIKR